jgi:putative ABC transport system permease protein
MGQATPVEFWTAPEFASRSQQYWLFDTGAGIAVLFMAVIVCFVGAVITNQSFASVVAGSVASTPRSMRSVQVAMRWHGWCSSRR